MRTVTLEFLRHGPAHNQLLSPLTRYMVLCGNHQAADVSVGFEHAQFLTKLRAFQYRETNVNREMQITETAAQMSSILAAVPGLVAELADSDLGAKSAITHLRLILSANELALLPFELANSASAFPGAGQSLALQPHVPICMTREVRRVSSPYLRWPARPKILFAASSAAGPIPLDAHMLALRRAVDPWLYHFNPDDDDERRRTIDEHIRVLPNASVQSLVDECSSVRYTHIHILAHGVEREYEYGRRYGLALHDSQDPAAVDFVEASRLAALLRPSLRGKAEDLALPTVVTVAACESGQVGSVVGAGASIAHALHEAGIPLVVASQFPLSFAGSIVMAEVLYEGFLEGADPRALLVRLRRELVARVPKTHDWASVVAYASFPQDLDRQLAAVRIQQAAGRIEAALNHADHETKQTSTTLSKKRQEQSPSPKPNPDRALQRLGDAIRRMESVPEATNEDRAMVYGLLASAEKRRAEVLWRLARRPEPAGGATTPNQVTIPGQATVTNQVTSPSGVTDTHYGARAIDSLRRSYDYYRRSFALDRSQAWALVQAMVLTAILEGPAEVDADEKHLARLLSEQDIEGYDGGEDLRSNGARAGGHASRGQREAWAHSNLIELELLAVLSEPDPAKASAAKAAAVREIGEKVVHILRAVGANSAELHSLRRQLLRYADFFPPIADYAADVAKRPRGPQWAVVQEIADMAIDKVPEAPRFE